MAVAASFAFKRWSGPAGVPVSDGVKAWQKQPAEEVDDGSKRSAVAATADRAAAPLVGVRLGMIQLLPQMK